jgi:hypothetical protein
MFGRTEVISRRQLHDLVWSSPMTEVAARYQLSDRGLAKICTRHKIPVPERGWWAKKAAGKEVRIPPLPLAETYLDQITLQIHDDFRDWLTSDERSDLDARLQREREEAWRVSVLEENSRAKRAPRKLQFRAVSAGARERSVRIAHAIIDACERRGYIIDSASEPLGTSITVCGEKIPIKLVEQQEGADHILTPREERERQAGRGWNIPKRDFTPTGRLTLSIEGYAANERRSFSDGQKQRLEDCLQDFMIALLRVAMQSRARTNYWEAYRQARRRTAALRKRRRHGRPRRSDVQISSQPQRISTEPARSES